MIQNEIKKIGDKTVLQRLKILLHPFVFFHKDASSGTFSITVVPESLRTYFYIEFWLFCFIGMIVSKLFSKTFNDEQNPIKDRFGNNNICIYFDEPPFSYFGAALFIPIILTGVLYLFVDIVRVYFNMLNPNIRKLTKRFLLYHWHFSFKYLQLSQHRI